MGYELNNIAYNHKYFQRRGLNSLKTTDELLELSKTLDGWSELVPTAWLLGGTRNWATIHPGYMTLFATWGGKDFEVVGIISSAGWTARKPLI